MVPPVRGGAAQLQRRDRGHFDAQVRVGQARFGAGAGWRVFDVDPAVINAVHRLEIGNRRQEDVDGEKTRAIGPCFLQKGVDLAEHIAGLLLDVGLAIFRDLASNIDETSVADGLTHTRALLIALDHAAFPFLGFTFLVLQGEFSRSWSDRLPSPNDPDRGRKGLHAGQGRCRDERCRTR
ncbi:hypothetical protein RHECNPAF_1360055 [Rhizobium etli CNPAF512]|nr:hypothetical protein RHECNPAF_1360055 [Rhizobium etli CNPAF512]